MADVAFAAVIICIAAFFEYKIISDLLWERAFLLENITAKQYMVARWKKYTGLAFCAVLQGIALTIMFPW